MDFAMLISQMIVAGQKIMETPSVKLSWNDLVSVTKRYSFLNLQIILTQMCPTYQLQPSICNQDLILFILEERWKKGAKSVPKKNCDHSDDTFKGPTITFGGSVNCFWKCSPLLVMTDEWQQIERLRWINNKREAVSLSILVWQSPWLPAANENQKLQATAHYYNASDFSFMPWGHWHWQCFAKHGRVSSHRFCWTRGVIQTRRTSQLVFRSERTWPKKRQSLFLTKTMS